MGKVAGRPKITTNDLPENWEHSIIFLYKNGASDFEIKCVIHDWIGSLSNSLWDRWISEDVKFNEVITKGRALAVTKKASPKNNTHIARLKKRRETRNNEGGKAQGLRSFIYYHVKNRGTSKSKKMVSLFGYTPKELIQAVESKFKEGMSHSNYGVWHIDHIKPLSQFNLSIESEVKEAFKLDNIRPLWGRLNCIKSNKL